MSIPDRTVRTLIEAAAHALRRDAIVAIGAAACALLPLILLSGWIVGGFPQPSLLPLVLDALLLVTAATVGVRARRRIKQTLDESAVARAAEAHLAMPAGALRGAIELDRSLPPGSSPALAQRSERALAAQMATMPSHEITGRLGAEWRRHRARALATFAGLVMAVFVVGFATPTRSRASWAPLLHPVRNLKAPPMAALAVKPGDASVPRGGNIDVRVRAHDRAAVTLHWRVEGDIVHEQTLPVLADTAAYALTHLDGITEYWVDSPDGAASPHYTLTPVDPLLLADLSVEITYPAYLNRPAERYDGEVPALELPQGTQLVMRGHATRALDSARLVADSAGAVVLHVDEAAFSTRWVPTRSGVYEWRMRDDANNQLAVQPTPIAITIIRDAAPTVTITFPARDTVFGAELQLSIAAEAQDDHGVSAASLITWRVSRTGAKDPPVETPLALGGNESELLQAVLDAGSRNLTSGDTLKYFLRVRDNSPMGQTGDSRTYSVVLPGMADLRDAATAQTDALMKANAEIAKNAAKLQEETRNTQRRTSASNANRAAAGQGGSPQDRMQFSESQGAQKVLDQQQQLMKNMDEMRAKVDALQKSLENAGLQDADMQKKLEDLRKLYDQAMTPEMRQKMDQLKQAIDKLDAKDVEKALKDLAAQQEQLKQQLERSMELMQRAASEQEMNRLSQETKELARQQDALASASNEQKDAKATAQQQTDVAKKTDEVTKQISDLKDDLQKRGEPQAAQGASKAVDSLRAAQKSMQQASSKASDGKQGDAQSDAKQAAQQLNDAAKQLDDARKDMVQSWKDQTQESMQQATRDALALAQKQQALKEQMDKAGSSIPKPAAPQPPQVGKQQQKSGQSPAASAQQGGQPQNSDKGSQGGAGGKDQPGKKAGGQQSAGSQGGAGQSGQPQPGQPGQPQPGQDKSEINAMRSEQSALQQGLQQLSQNLQQTGDRSAQVNRDVGSSLSKANQSMQQTMDALQNATPDSQLPSDQAGQTVDALNKLALSLLKNSQEVEQSQSGTGAQQMMQQMSDIAKQQGSLNGQGSSLAPMNIGPGAMSEQVRKLGQSQQQIAQQLNDVNKSAAKDRALGSVEELAKEAAAIAQEMASGRLEPQTMARQEKLFHRLLDAGRSLEKDEVSNQRVAERPGTTTLSQPAALDPKLFKDGTRFRAPTPEELRAMPPAYRKIILDYFERLNHPAAAVPGAPDKSK